MKKKKLLVLLPAVLMMLGSCGPNDSSSSDVPPSSDSSSSSVPSKDSDSSSSSSEEAKSYKVSITAAEHVTVTPDKTEAKVGETVTFNIVVDDEYELSYFKINGADVEVKDGKASAAMAEGGLYVTLSAVSKKYDVTIEKVENVTVIADVDKTIIGATVTFTITPDDGYTLVSFKVNGNDVEVKEGKAEAQMVKGGLTAVASVEKTKYAVSIDKDIVNGGVTADKQTAAEGEDVSFIIQPNEDYELDTFKVNGQDVAVVNNKATVKMVKNGLSVTATFKGIQHAVTIDENIINGKVTSDKASAATGEDVTFTITPNEGYELAEFKVNESVIEVKEGKAVVQMVKTGLSATATFTDGFEVVSEITGEFKNKVEAAEDIKYRIANDMTVDELPLAKKSSIIDLNGKTLTVSDNNVILAELADQEVTLYNGKIVFAGTASETYKNFFTLKGIKSFSISNVEISSVNSMWSTSAVFDITGAGTFNFENITVDAKTTYGIGTNNLEGEAPKIFIDNSKIAVHDDATDNCAIIVNVDGESNIEIKNSTLTADRQAVIARTGNWTIENSTLVNTCKWIKLSDENKSTDATYLTSKAGNNTWGAGNKVPSAPLVVGDTNAGAYKRDAKVTLDNVEFSSDSTNYIVAREDGTYASSIEMDALTYLNSYGHTDIAADVEVKKNNVIEKTIAEMSNLTAADSKNLYVVTGNVSSLYNTAYGNGYLVDEEGKTLQIYGTYTSEFASQYSVTDGVFKFDNTGAKGLDASYVGKEITVIGVLNIYNKKPQIKNGVAFAKDVAVESLAVEYNSEEGSVVVNGEAGKTKVGETVTLTVTPNEGYKIDSVKLTKQGNTTDITQDLSFAAGRSNKIVVTFAKDLPDSDSYTLSFNKDNNSKGVSSYTDEWTNKSMGKKFKIVNFNNYNNNWNFVRCGSNKSASVASISSIDLFKNALSKISIEFGGVTTDAWNSAKLYVSDDADFKNEITVLDIAPVSNKTVDIAIDKPTANCYYKLVFDMKKSSSNGTIEVKTVTFSK